MSLLIAALLSFTSLQEPAKGIQITDGAEVVKLGETPASFKGDATLSNGRITLVIPKSGTGVEIRVGTATRAVLRLTGVAKMDQVAVSEYGKGSAILEIGNAKIRAKLKVKKGDV